MCISCLNHINPSFEQLFQHIALSHIVQLIFMILPFPFSIPSCNQLVVNTCLNVYFLNIVFLGIISLFQYHSVIFLFRYFGSRT